MKRNLFDHYSQLENHITNSFLSVLNENPRLTKNLLRDLGIKINKGDFKILSQRMPIKDKYKSSTIDGAIFATDFSFCAAIENKIYPKTVRKSQLQGHLRQITPFPKGLLWVITPDEYISLTDLKKPNNIEVVHTSWASITRSLIGFGPDQKKTIGEKLLVEFIAFLERRPDLAGFHGFRFDYGYEEELARNYVKRVTPELSEFIKKTFKRCINTRPSITGAWDAWYPSKEPQKSIHPGYYVGPEYLRCNVVLANGCGMGWKNFSLKLQEDEKSFISILRKIERKKPTGSEAIVSFRQRHYPSQRSKPITDAETTVRMSTLLGTDGSKENEIWMNLIKDIARTKSKYNYQLEIGYNLIYEQNSNLTTEKAIKEMKKSFSALTEIYKFLTE